ncbi:MAG: hypothetical protein P1U85_10345 [Verrucomicrobiales bacterium]|nr:hypothetical protein [Verrucomicrobiales bacterium]
MSQNDKDKEPEDLDPEEIENENENTEASTEDSTPEPSETAQPPELPPRSEPGDNPELSDNVNVIVKPSEIPSEYQAMESAPSLGSIVDALLKSPTRLLYEWQEGRRQAVVRFLGLIFAVSFLVFGLLLGMFSGESQLWIVPLKVLGGATVTALITLPSLYVFSSLGGYDMTLQRACGLLLSGLALIGVILLGLAPVLWIFTQSTNSVGFMGFLVLIFWMSALGFGMGMILKNAKVFGNHKTGYLVLWTIIFVTVTLQMSTSLRPLLGPTEETIFPTEKRFFLEHWTKTLTESNER